jgi:hypothetical protein
LTRPSLVSAISLIVALGVGSCGGDDADDRISLPSGSTPKADYVSQVNAICAESTDRLKQSVKVDTQEAIEAGEPFQSAVYGALENATPGLNRVIDEATAIPPPEADREQLEEFWTALRDIYQLLPALSQAAKAGDEGEIARIGLQMSASAGPALTFPQEYGLTECADEHLPAGTEDLLDPSSPTSSPDATSTAGSGFPPYLRRKFIEACAGEGTSQTLCACMADELANDVPVDDMIQAGLRREISPELRREIKQAGQTCLVAQRG